MYNNHSESGFSSLNSTNENNAQTDVTVGGVFGTTAIGNSNVTFDLSSISASTSSPLRSIEWGTPFPGSTVDVFFGNSGYSLEGYRSEGFNAYEIGQFQAAFDLISSVSGLSFNIVNSASAADFKLVLDTNEFNDDGLLGFFSPPGYSNSGNGVFNGSAWDRSAGGDLEVGGYGFTTITHEILHGLGFAHPHDSAGSSTTMSGVGSAFGDAGNYDLNQGLYTSMTYNTGYLTGDVGTSGGWGSWGYDAGPMALDIALLQEMYGANNTTASGDTVYTLPDGNATGTYWTAIWDTGGTDTIEYTGATDTTIDLRAATLQYEYGGGGWVSAADGTAGGFTIANGVVIENAAGGSGDDTITGNGAANALNGGDGNDEIAGGAGADILYGDAGNDNLYGNTGNDTISGGDGGDLMNGGIGNDTLNGDAGSDTLNGNDGVDTLNGGTGVDTLNGGTGNDTLNGGDGNDTLNGDTGDDRLFGDAGDDDINGGDGRDSIKGGDGDDTIHGGNDSDYIRGQNGDDIIHGEDGNDYLVGHAGYDTIYGDDGRDTIKGHANDDLLFGGAGNDTIRGNANNDGLYGGSGDDRLIGHGGNDYLAGDAGNDELKAGSGDDTLLGGDGDDRLIGMKGADQIAGGAGADTFVFIAAAATDVVADYEVGIDALEFDASYWTGMADAAALVAAYATVTASGVAFDFGGGNVLTLDGLTTTDGLAADVVTLV